MTPEHKITHAIIAAQVTLNHIEGIKHTGYYRQELKKKINIVLPELIKAEADYDAFFYKHEASTSEVYDAYDHFIKAVASVPIWECQNVTAIIEAFRKDPKSLEGIVNKINKKNP